MEVSSMIAIIGATGQVGSSTAAALRAGNLPVRAIVRDPGKASKLQDMGCEIATADLQDAHALSRAIGDAEAVQMIAPLAPNASDPAADLRRSMDSVVQAILTSRPRRVLAISDYGAHVGEDIGIPSLFHELEQRLRLLKLQVVILRSAEHMHNWTPGILAALDTGMLPSFQLPIDAEHPTIAAHDLGRISANLLQQPMGDETFQIMHAEGPRRYSAQDVANALATLSGQPIQAHAVPPEQWPDAFANMPPSLAQLVIKTNRAKNAGGVIEVEPNVGEVLHGTTDLIDAMRPIVVDR
jgi:NAD(P)H dehydrogenase (quinone)